MDVLSDGRIIFSCENSVAILDPDTGEVTVFAKSPHLRYSRLSANTKTPWVLAIEEDHSDGDTAVQIRHRLVAIHGSTGEVKRIAEDADF
ncbi:hypothetical protein ESCO_002425 [Escovopsis weberi]|uniref:Uncharacterized protein n=1 Tax=Escovopsis weberi TaxID=150374 RepID=A0A0M9VSN0_ESCWE|nr:hypothetical protein ESCO_002425 [Escovopsis weberi]